MAVTTAPARPVVANDVGPRYLEWGPIILGALGALAIMVVLLTFGAALGLSVVSPYPYAGLSGTVLAILAALYGALAHVASFSAGGYLAGRVRSPWAGGDGVEQQFRDGSYGFAVWALGVVLGAALVLSGVSGALKTATEATTAVAAAGTAGAAANPAAGQAVARVAMEPTDYAVDRLLAPAPGAARGPQLNRADLAAPITRTFAANLGKPQLDPRDRTYLAQLVTQQTGLPQADAEKRVDEAFTELKAAEQKVRDAADKARKASLIAAFLAAATMAIGCAAACAGAALGARHRDERTALTLFGARRFW